MWIVPVAICFVVVAIYLFLVFPAKPKKEDYTKFSKRSYAHRGFHDNEEGPSENVVEAFAKATELKYGIELDVQLTKDKKVVVFHDSDLKRTSGLDSKVLDVEYEELKNIKVFDRENIPLFSEVLKNIGNDIPLIVEIKSEGGREWVNETCRLTYDLLKDFEGIYCIESFDPFAVGWFKKNAPEVVRGQLASSRESYKGSVKPFTAFLLHNLFLNCIGRPHFIAYDHEANCFNLILCRLFGSMIVRWTIKSKERHDELQAKSDGLIFEGYEPKNIW